MNVTTFIKEILRGKDLYRIFMNQACATTDISGEVLDLGSGKKLASYHRFLKQSPNTKFNFLDLQRSPESGQIVDLEKDILPFASGSIDNVLLFNLLEHLENYGKVLEESRTVLKNGGRIVGAVPFLVGYHPDPRDFWRFTVEALEKILNQVNFKNVRIKVLGYGPFIAGFSQMEFVFPRILKLVILPVLFLLDWLLFAIKPTLDRRKFALGLFFTATK